MILYTQFSFYDNDDYDKHMKVTKVDKFALIFFTSPDSFGTILIIAQVYEWSIMIYSIWY
jgi:hypothetical protein